MSKRKLNHAFVVTIVHGKSEYNIVEYIYQAIKQPSNNIYALKKGKQFNSIQITSLKHVLNSYPFNSIKNMNTHFRNLNIKNGKILNFKIAIIMDTDDCDHKTKQMFLDKSLFFGHPLYDYIWPIYNTENLEDVFDKCTIEYPDNKKKNYSKIFRKGIDSIEAIEEIRQKLMSRPQATNMDEYIDYCLKNYR